MSIPATGRASDIDDPMRGPERPCRGEEGLPIGPASWREDLGTLWTTVLLVDVPDI
jgi:hypothetical protein